MQIERAEHLKKRKEVFEKRKLAVPGGLNRPETDQNLASLGGRGNKGFASDTAEMGQSNSGEGNSATRNIGSK